MDGIVNVIKPPGMSSHQVVSRLRRVLQMRKIGHTGTLDPGAAGVLSLCLGKATRVVSYLLEKDKRYIAEMTLGVDTDTQDGGGKTLDVQTGFCLSPQQLAETLNQFRGQIDQLPPMTSAVRVQGQRLYKAARQGREVERTKRTVTIHELHVNKIWPEGITDLHFGSRIVLDVRCSKGTYIRTLCHDIGSQLGVGAHMSFLARVESGPFALEDSFTLEEITAMAEDGNYRFVLPIERALPDWPRVTVSPWQETAVSHGNAADADGLISVPQSLVIGDEVMMFDLEGNLLALGRIEQGEKLICQPFRVLKSSSN